MLISTEYFHRKCAICSIYMKFGKVRNKRAVSVSSHRNSVGRCVDASAKAKAQSTQQKN